MDIKTFLAFFGILITSAVASGTAAATATWLMGTWFKARIENSVRHEYDIKVKELEAALRRREKAAVIAEFLAEWDSKPEDTKRENQLAAELSLWLPAELVREFTATMCYKKGAKTPNDLLVLVRKYLAGGVDDGLRAEDIVYFPRTPKQSQPSLD